MWDLFVGLFIGLLLVFYRYLGQPLASVIPVPGIDTILAVVLLTLLSRLAVLPLTLRQQRVSQQMQEIQPELQKLQKKYGDQKEKLAQEQMRLYKEYGINPTAGCLPLLIQFPVMIAIYQAVVRALAVTPFDLLHLATNLSIFPGLARLIPLQSQFLWLDLGQPDRYFVLPVLVMVTSWLSQKLLTPPSAAADERTAAMNQQMQIMMPLMFGFISISYASGLSIYFVISNLVTILQFFLLGQGKKKGNQGNKKKE